MTTYPYGPGTYNAVQLHNEIVAVGGALAAILTVEGSGQGTAPDLVTNVDCVFADPLAAADKTRLDNVVASHVAQTYTKPLPTLGASVWYCTRPADYTAGVKYAAMVAQVLSGGTQVNVAYLDSSGGWFKDGPIPFLQSGQPLPGSKGFAFWPSYSPT